MEAPPAAPTSDLTTTVGDSSFDDFDDDDEDDLFDDDDDDDDDDLDDDDEGDDDEDEDGSWDEEDEDEMAHAMAEQAKEDIRRQLRELKAMYRSIKQRNQEIPPPFRLSESSLRLPRKIYEPAYERILFDCYEAYRLHEYEAAQTLIPLDKMTKAFFNAVDTPHIVLKDISHELQVHTIRNKKTTLEFEDLLKKNLETLEEEERTRLGLLTKAQEEALKDMKPVRRMYAEDFIGEYKSRMDTFDADTIHKIRRLEKRLEQKFERECAWQALMANKVPANYVAPEDLELLNNAKTNSGAFPLKLSEGYAGDLLTVAERRNGIIQTKLAMREEVRKFNKLFFEALEEKPRVLQECRRLEKEIRKVQVLLPEECRRKIPPIYDMEPEENPESIFEITSEEIEAEEQKRLAAANLSHVEQDINEEFYGAKKPEKDIFEEEVFTYLAPPPPAARAARQARLVDIEYESVPSNRCRKIQFNPQNDSERKKFEVLFFPRIYRQEMLFKELERVIKYFNRRVKYLLDLRVRIEIESKIKTIGLLSLFHELDYSKEFVEQEKAVKEVVDVEKEELRSLEEMMDKVKDRLTEVNNGVKKCEEDVQTTIKDVEKAIGLGNKFKEYLWRVFKKQVKKPSSNEEEDNEDEDDDEEEEDEDDDQQQDSIATDEPITKDPSTSDSNFVTVSIRGQPNKTRLDLDVCPPNCDPGIYDRIVALRARRMKNEKDIAKGTGRSTKLTAKYMEFDEEKATFDGRFKELEEDVRVLKRKRLKKMNDLRIMVVLRVDQVQCMDKEEVEKVRSGGGSLMDILAQCFPGTSDVVIFPSIGQGGLKARTEELNGKAKDEFDKYKRGKHMLARLGEEFHKLKLQVDGLQSKTDKEMTQKFGQIVDMDEVAASLINLTLQDKEKELSETRIANYNERAKAAGDIAGAKHDLTSVIQDNTKFNMLHAVMLERKRDLDYYINRNEEEKVLLRELMSMNSIQTGVDDKKKSAMTTGSRSNSDIPLSSCLTKSDNRLEILDDQVHKAQDLVDKQKEKIRELKEVLTKCRTKTGLPPLLHRCCE